MDSCRFGELHYGSRTRWPSGLAGAIEGLRGRPGRKWPPEPRWLPTAPPRRTRGLRQLPQVKMQQCFEAMDDRNATPGSGSGAAASCASYVSNWIQNDGVLGDAAARDRMVSPVSRWSSTDVRNRST